MSRYSWIWLFFRPSAGSLIGMTISRAVPHDRRHERGVLGGDLVVVEVDELAEAEHLGVEPHPLVEPALLDVADDVVDPGQADLRPDRRRGQVLGRRSPGSSIGPRSGCGSTKVCDGLAVGADLRQPSVAVLVRLGPRGADRAGTAGHAAVVGRGCIVDQPGQVVDAVAVACARARRSASRRSRAPLTTKRMSPCSST